ncbi:4-hydroxy-tetrahydrodipicolinate synthase [Vulcaniibacterium thermophilum]|uniref:4-hydroxy-tetrahydrodipicolinate synthase n=1 Tax=Vulcaniibacterium thermophilum TaxID=1169913 RepID=A0A918YUZ5_9GAMM|nr:4-hydroxy-tetrahydrodipicolinate synthase [Vulcaniibacterium thermophilum]GHE25444.1 4-hydroxy-tetrahydrodipicolinate synthase [Vulcaniibacterium thermophilum]
MRLTGSITALATPFDAAGELDLDAWRRLLQMQIEGGTQAVVVAGSTGEAAALFDAEYDTLLRIAVEEIAGRIPVLAGTGLSNTTKTIELTRRAALLGADAALVVTPPYVRPTQAGLIAHYRAIADDGALPVVLYNVPGRTGGDLLPETVAELVDHPRIVAIKEARSEPERMEALLRLKSESFAVLSGDDPTACRAMLAGADGVISVASNVIPGAFRRLCDLARGGERAGAETWNARLMPLFDFLGVEPNPIPVKAVLQRMGVGHGLRLPLLPLSAVHQDSAARMTALAIELETERRDALVA